MPYNWIYNRVSEIMDLGKEACPIYPSGPYNRPCVIALYRLESVSVSLADR